MNTTETDVPSIPPDPKQAPPQDPLVRPTHAPELIRLTPPAAFSALVREIASRSTH